MSRRKTAISVALAALSVLAGTTSVSAQPSSEKGLVLTTSVGVGWTKSSYQVGGQEASLSGAAFDPWLGAGYRRGPVTIGGGGGALLVPREDGTAIAGTRPESLWLLHAGAFLNLSPLPAKPLVLAARLELAHAIVSGETFDGDHPTSGVVGSATGGLATVSAFYSPVVTRDDRVLVGAETCWGLLPGAREVSTWGLLAVVGGLW